MKRVCQEIILMPLALIAILSGCGGGSSSAGQPSGTTTPVTPTTGVGQVTPTNVVTKSGVITGFGSIYLDGVRYTTDDVEVSANGASANDLQAIQVGMRVGVVFPSSSDDGSDQLSVSHLYYESDIEGVVTAIDRSQNLLSVAGVQVHYNDLTRFLGTSAATLAVGQRVEVSGHFAADLPFLATYIELETRTDDVQKTVGLISNLNDAARTFSLGRLTVDYSAAQLAGTLANGQRVRVTGSISQSTATGVGTQAVLSAATVSSYATPVAGLLPDSTAFALLRQEIEGVLTAYSDDRRTIFVDGLGYPLTAGLVVTLPLYQYVEIHLSATGEVTQVELEDDFFRSDGVVKGVIQALTSDPQTVSVNQIDYVFSQATRFEDDDDKSLSFSGLQVGQNVEISFATIGGQRVVQRIERESGPGFFQEVEIKGVITSIAGSTVVVNGVSLNLTANVRYLVHDLVVSQSQFLQTLTTSSIVEAEGYLDSAGNFVLSKIEIENEHYSSSGFYNGQSTVSGSGSDSSNDNDGDDDASSSSSTGNYVEIEGVVTSLLSSDSAAFELNNIRIELDDRTTYEFNDRNVDRASFLSALRVGLAVEVEGTRRSTGAILALEAEIE